jgi:hypothetical protein
MALTATNCHKSVTVDDTSVTISGNQWLSGSNQRPSGGNYRSLPAVDGAQDAIEDRVAPTRAHLRLKVNQRSIRGQLEVIGALSRARRLVRTVLILARFHADGDEPNESISTVEVRRDGDTDGDISTVEVRRDGDTDGETDGDSVRSGSSAARADIRLSGMGEADEEGTGEGECDPKDTAILGTGACRRD